MVVLSREGSFVDSRSFDTYHYHTKFDEMGAFIDGLSDNVIVLIAVKDEGWHGGDAAESAKQGADHQLLQLGAINPRPSGWRASWALVGYKGPHDQLDWIRFAEASATHGPSEITVKIPYLSHHGCA